MDSGFHVLSISAGDNWGYGASSQMQTPVYRGTATLSQPAYVSERGKKYSNSCILRNFAGGISLATSYKCGLSPPRIIQVDPHTPCGAVQYRDGDTVLSVKSHFWSTRVDLTRTDDSQTFEWNYTRTEVNSKKRRVLVLSKTDASRQQQIVLAVLLRTDGTRTPGTSKWSSGNGGQLLINSKAEAHMTEALIVATCLMMLKKEVDRAQGAAAAAAT